MPFYATFAYFGELMFFLGWHDVSFFCDATTELRKIEFKKRDLIIRILAQINLSIQYLKYLTVSFAILCCCHVIWGISQPFLGVCEVTDEPKKL